MKENLFHIITFCMFSFLFIAFKTNNIVNISFKILCFGLSMWGLLIILYDNGFLVKIVGGP